jgi:hypothetical protein
MYLYILANGSLIKNIFSIRNTGMGFTSLLAMVIGIAGPYVVHLGTVDVRYPYGIMGIISLCGAIAVSFTT